MAELYEKILFVKLFVIVIIDSNRYPSTYCLMQGSCFIYSNLNFREKKNHFKIRVTSDT